MEHAEGHLTPASYFILMFNLFEFQAIDNGELESMLARSRASAAFRSDVSAYLSSGFAPAIHVEGRAPRVKVVRLIKHVLATLPEFELQRVSVHARSGCSDFIGTVRLESDSELRVFDFVWCCRWRAEEQGWEDAFGLPDQIRAAEEFDWRCFQHWKERAVDDAVALVP